MALNGEIVKKYLKKFPNTPNLTLAKKIYKENSKLFTNVDSVRSLIRSYLGQAGQKNRKLRLQYE